MPQMGVSVAEGTVVEWRKQRGDWVEADETICEISTDKIDTEVPSPAGGRARRGARAGRRDGRRRHDARAHRHRRAPRRAAQLRERPPAGAGAARRSPPAAPADARAPAAPPRRARPAAARGSAARRYSPVVQRIADEHGVDLDEVEGSGRDGRVQKKDVMAYVQARGGGAPAGSRPTSRRSTSRARTGPAPAAARR